MVEWDACFYCALIAPAALRGGSAWCGTMRFSRRTNWNTEESELARAHRTRVAGRAADRRPDGLESDALRLSLSTGILAALGDARALDYDPQPQGLLRAREAVCAYYAGARRSVAPEQIVLTTSTSEAYSFLFRLLCDPGSEILVPQPGYPLFDFLAVLDDVRLKPAPLVYDHGWQIDPRGISPGDHARDARDRAGASQQSDRPLHQAVGGGGTGAAVPGVRSFADRG